MATFDDVCPPTAAKSPALLIEKVREYHACAFVASTKPSLPVALILNVTRESCCAEEPVVAIRGVEENVADVDLGGFDINGGRGRRARREGRERLLCAQCQTAGGGIGGLLGGDGVAELADDEEGEACG